MEPDINTNEKFRLLLEQLQDNVKTFRANVWGTMGFLVLVIGSLITSQTIQDALRTSSSTAKLTFALTFFIVCLHTLVLISVYVRSKRLLSAMHSLAYMEPMYYKYYGISFAHLSVSTLIDAALFVIIAVVIANLSGYTQSLEYFLQSLNM